MSWWRRLAARGRLERELHDELADHLERQTREYMDTGMSEADARRRAAAAFGGREAVKDACRDARGTRWIEDAVRDARYAVRSLRKQPVSAVAATLCLGLAIGATTAIFGLVDAVVLRPLPVSDPHRLVLLGERATDREMFSWSISQFQSFAQSPVLSGICAFRPRTDFSVSRDGQAETAAGQLLSGGCFRTLGIRPALGRLFDEEDDHFGDARPVAVISYRFWLRQFGGDPHVIGRSLDVRGLAVTITGVTPAGFDGLEPGRTVDVSVPLSLQPSVGQGRLLASPRVRWLRVIGRLSPGITRERAAAELEARWAHLVPPPATGPANRFMLLDGAQGLNDLRAQFSGPLGLVFAAVALLLLLACANLASLVLARNRSREHEVALRLALGAGRGRVARQLFAESLVLALLAGGAGLVFASWGSQTIVTLLSRGRTPILIDVSLDARIVLFAFAVSVVTSVLFGMWPALKASRANLQPDLQAGARTHTHARALGSRGLIAAQTMLSIVLVVAAVLFARSLTKLYRTDLGLDMRRVLIVGIGFGVAGARNAAPIVADLSERLSDTAGIRSVTQMMDLPFGGTSYRAGVSVSGRPESADDQVGYNFVGPRFFETMGIPLLEGRDFRADDDARGRPVAVVSRSLAVRFFAASGAVGERLQLQGAVTPVEIVGVAKDVPYEGVRAERELVLYRPQRQAPLGVGTFAIRADLPPSAVLETVRRALHDVAPSVPIVSIMTLEDLFDGSIATERLLSNIAAFFGVMALLLVAIGMYGTLASALAERTREFGVRLALGATAGDIVRMIMGGALLPVVCGLAAGLPVAFAGTRLARSALFGMTPRDPATYLMSAGVVLMIAVAAALPPALAAIRANPIAALREN